MGRIFGWRVIPRRAVANIKRRAQRLDAATPIAPAGAAAMGREPRAAAAVQVQFSPDGPQASKIYEYTLRMQDGSIRVFQETLPTSWRLGERMMLIESNGALD
jgi:hypothetical protein